MTEQNKLQDHLNVVFIDEVYHDKVKENKIILGEQVMKDMLAQGLDPLNRDDIQRYWKLKGIESNG